MGLRSESQQDIWPEIYQTPQEEMINPSNADKDNLQPDRFGDMSPREFSDLTKKCSDDTKDEKQEKKFQEIFPVDPEKYRQYMLSQDETGELAKQIEKLKNRPNTRFDLDTV